MNWTEFLKPTPFKLLLLILLFLFLPLPYSIHCPAIEGNICPLPLEFIPPVFFIAINASGFLSYLDQNKLLIFTPITIALEYLVSCWISKRLHRNRMKASSR